VPRRRRPSTTAQVARLVFDCAVARAPLSQEALFRQINRWCKTPVGIVLGPWLQRPADKRDQQVLTLFAVMLASVDLERCRLPLVSGRFRYSGNFLAIQKQSALRQGVDLPPFGFWRQGSNCARGPIGRSLLPRLQFRPALGQAAMKRLTRPRWP